MKARNLAICQGGQLGLNRLYTQIPLTVERFKFDLNRKRSKLECYGLFNSYKVRSYLAIS
jgi:hypothetical protein